MPATRELRRATTAARKGNLKRLERIITRSPDVLAAKDAGGRTLLDLACRAATCDIAIPLEPGTPEQHAAIDLILAAGADPATADNDGWTPLHSAGMAGHADLVRRLVAAGAPVDANAYGKAGGSALSYSLFYAKPYMGEVLIPVYPDNLRAAASLGHDLSRFLGPGGELTPAAHDGLDFYAPAFFPSWERTLSRQEVLDEALSWAARNNQGGSIEALVKLGADVNANPFRGTPLLWACYSDKVEAAACLLDLGADPDLRHDFGGEGHGVQAVAMHLAAQHSALKCLDLLLDRGADPSIVDVAYDATPLEWAEECGAADAAELLRRRT
ncbi:MAG: ankyrin repeat domain-containing protein [Acidobacteria bacterium]|nr:ankyrin repeat domain-containing protein [Acidobacteriota bacterium]